MKILKVETKVTERSIPFSDLDSVKAALQLFESGQTRASRETQRLGIGQVGDGMASMIMTLVGGNNASRFLERMFEQIDTNLAASRNFYGSYDYDGPGVFHKSSVQVDKTDIPGAPYLLSLSAAYVGDQPEAGLADALGIERGLVQSEVRLELAPVGKRFEFDLADFAKRFRLIKRAVPTPEEMGQNIMAGRSDYEGGMAYQPGNIDLHHRGLMVTFSLDNYSVGDYYSFETGNVGWTLSGNVISGPLKESYERRGQYMNPVATVTVSPVSPYKRLPVFDEATKLRVQEVTAKTAAAFQ